MTPMPDLRDVAARAMWDDDVRLDDLEEKDFFKIPAHIREHYLRRADAVLAALHLLPSVAGDVIRRALTPALREYMGAERYARDYEYCDAQFGHLMQRALEAAAPIIAADAERRVREECAQIAEAYGAQQEDVTHEPTGTKVWDAEQIKAACADIAQNIRKGPNHA